MSSEGMENAFDFGHAVGTFRPIVIAAHGELQFSRTVIEFEHTMALLCKLHRRDEEHQK